MANDNLIFKDLWFKNFLSFGNTLHHIKLDGEAFSVILGENLDTGGEDSRNGVGKSALIDALSFVLFGKSIREVSGPKLVNKSMGKLMMVIVEFERSGIRYRVERGIGPDILTFYQKPIENTDPWDLKGTDRKYLYSKTEKRKDDTTDAIILALGLDFDLFGLLVAISSEADPFLKRGEEGKRKIIENLFGIKLLAERAIEIKEERRTNKIELSGVESAITATQAANKRVQEQIADMEARALLWEQRHTHTVAQLQASLDRFATIKIDDELAVLREIDDLQSALDGAFQQQRLHLQEKQAREREVKMLVAQHDERRRLIRQQQDQEVRALDREILELSASQTRNEKLLKQKESELAKLAESTCPTCTQHWVPEPEVPQRIIAEVDLLGHDIELCREQREAALAKKQAMDDAPINPNLEPFTIPLPEAQDEPEDLSEMIGQLQEMIDEMTAPLSFQTIEEAVETSARIQGTTNELQRIQAESNPHTGSIEKLRTEAIMPIDFTRMDELKELIEHADLLVTLLTSSDSFIRKELIDRYLPVLNGQIKRHLADLGLPHRVRFNTDLTCDIVIGRDEYDYGNLSKGERLRLTLALDLAFLDLYEYMQNPINTLLIDELLDNGMDLRGAENGVNILQGMVDQKHKSVFLITHRGDIADRVDDVIKIRKENGFSKIIYD